MPLRSHIPLERCPVEDTEAYHFLPDSGGGGIVRGVVRCERFSPAHIYVYFSTHNKITKHTYTNAREKKKKDIYFCGGQNILNTHFIRLLQKLRR